MVAGCQTALLQISVGLLPGGGLRQVVAKERDRFLQQGAQALVLVFLGLFLRRHRRQHDPGAFSQRMQRLAEIPAFFFHHKVEDIAALVALAKTAPGARIGEDDKGRRARVRVERAKPNIILPGPAQLHRLRKPDP